MNDDLQNDLRRMSTTFKSLVRLLLVVICVIDKTAKTT